MSDSERIEALEASVKFLAKLVAKLKSELSVVQEHVETLAEHDLKILKSAKAWRNIQPVKGVGPIGHTCPSTT